MTQLSILECVYSVLYELEQERQLTPQEIEQKRQEKIQSTIYKNQTKRAVKGTLAQVGLGVGGSVLGLASGATGIPGARVGLSMLGAGAGMLANKKINDPLKAQKEDQKAIQKVNDKINKKYYSNQQQG